MNEANTLGRRIQEGRRTAGLSQEALGEQLNVSRQAVSKWESDAAIPELENLIAMSRIFGISVGELLGVEEPSECMELSERELAPLEAIAVRYAGEQKRWMEKRLRTAAVLGAAAVLCILALAAVTGLHILDANRRMDSLQTQLDSVRGQSTVVYQQPAAQDPLLAASDVAIVDFDPEAETFTLRLSATPAEQKVGTTAAFSAVLADGAVLTRPAEGETVFTAEGWTVPMSASVDLSVIFTSGDDVRTVQMGSLSAAPEDFQFQASAWWNASWSGKGDSVRLGDLSLQITAYQIPGQLIKPLELVGVEACLYRNRETAPELILPVEEAPELWRSSGEVSMENLVDYQTSFRLEEEGETMTAALRMKDNYGRTTYHPLGGWKRSGGEIQSLFMDGTDWTPGTVLE